MTQTAGTPLASLIDAHAIVTLHDLSTAEWHRLSPPVAARDASAEDFTKTLRVQHQANFELWHLEDEARSPYAVHREIAMVKRTIDSVNQRRNDLMERCDALLLEALHPHGLPAPVAVLHSETPGLILDRLSILALKIFHTGAEAQRVDASPGHIRKNKERLQMLEEQRVDLAECLDRLWEQIIHGQRRFKLYRQLKMYNDPSLNPTMYRKPQA